MSSFRLSVRLATKNKINRDNNFKNNRIINTGTRFYQQSQPLQISSSSSLLTSLQIQKHQTPKYQPSSFLLAGTAAAAGATTSNNKFIGYSSVIHSTHSTNSFAQISNQRNYSTLLHRNSNRANNARSFVMSPKNVRSVHIKDITKNIQLLSDEPRNVELENNTLRLKNPVQRPLVVVLSWLLAKEKYLTKYAQVYTDQGFDVITISVTPWQLLWPVKGTQVVANDVVQFLDQNQSYGPILLHGFSVGGYLWGECMVIMSQNTQKYQESIINRICGQIWDSAADITEIPIGVPKAVFPKNYTMQNALKSYMQYHLRTFHEVATQHYVRSSQMFHNNIVRTPALFLVSKNDPVGSESSNQSVRNDWESLNIQCTWKCWDKSSHVSHYIKHKQEYLEAVFNHLQLVNMIPVKNEKLRAKL